MLNFVIKICIIIYALEIGYSLREGNYNEVAAWTCALSWALADIKSLPKKSS